MAGRLSFSIAINLLTENFKSGTSQVKQSLKSMQMQVLTFAAAIGGVGLGLNDFVSKLISTARETGRVTTALKNVSGSTLQYVENQRFLLSMAKKYGSEINALTNAYAKFTAAASTAGMSVKDQQKIFESVSRATTAFGLSADDSNGVFLALSQMMSKGKISAEELRGQMGERLPIAFQAMAKAAGTSVAGLDKLMKAGSVMSAEVLPKFADALNSMIPNVNTDNVETSVNRLQNAFTSFTKGTGVQSAFKSLIDGVTGLVTTAAGNIKQIINALISFAIGSAFGKFFGWLKIEIAKAQRTAMFAAAKAAKASGVAFDAAAWKAQSGAATISTAFKTAGAAMKSAFMSILPAALVMAITDFILNLKTMQDEANKINKLYSDYQEGAKTAVHTQEIIQLQVLQGIINDVTKSDQERQHALSKVNNILGITATAENNSLKNNLKINDAINKRIGLLEATAKVDYYTRKKIESEDRKAELLNQMGGAAGMKKISGYATGTPGWAMKLGVNAKYENMLTEYINQDRINKNADSQLRKYIGQVPGDKAATPYVESDSKKSKQTELEKAQESYSEKLRELDAELAIGKISQQEYNKSFDELNKSALVEAIAMNDTSKAHGDYVTELKKKVAAPKYNATQDEFDKIQTEYNKSLKELTGQRNAGAITEQEYSDKTKDLIESTMGLTASLLGADAKATEFYNNLLIKRAEVKNPSLKTRDTTYDYKKSKTDISSENLEVAKQNLETIKSEYNKSAEDFTDKLNAAMDNVTTLEDALKIATVKQDIEDLSNEINKGIFSGVKDVASSADRMVSSFQNIRDVFSNVDSSGWERIMAVWNALINTVDGFMSIIDMISNLTALINKLGIAKEAEAAIETKATAVKVSNIAIESTARVAAAAAITEAATIQMAAESAAAYAYIPFAGVGLAAGQIAAMQALIAAAAIPKFENGGIVGGSSYTGDKILARLNSGEMVLNKSQQNIVGAAISRGSGTNVVLGGQVRGSDLYLVMSNYLKKTGKKL